MKTKSLIFTAILLPLLFTACQKEESMAPITILLTDQPAEYEEVNVHITGIEVKLFADGAAWIPINTNDSIYNLLDLKDGITTVLAQDTLPVGELKEIRFILGLEGNTVVTGGNSYPLETPSATDSGLKIKVDKDLHETMNTFTLDFVADLSVNEENGVYRLSPVIKMKL